jgi:hypothetical protein
MKHHRWMAWQTSFTDFKHKKFRPKGSALIEAYEILNNIKQNERVN